MLVTYVVLHYIATNDTIDCVRSIINNVNNLDGNETKIVVIDNGSPNNSYKDLVSALGNLDDIYILKSEENLGFARGNNIGFKYAKYTLKSDFIILVNNDTLIEQPNFNEVIFSKFIEKQFAVLGPDIITADGYHQNPLNKQNWGFTELSKFRIKNRIKLLLTYAKSNRITKKVLDGFTEVYRKETLRGDVENTALHGACLIFSPIYIKRFDGLSEETFLYMEEDILKLFADFYGFPLLYSSELFIYHKEDVATNMIQVSAMEKKRRKYRYLIQSSRSYTRLKKRFVMKKMIVSRIEKIASSAKKNKSYKIDLDLPLTYLVGMLLERTIMLIRGKIRSINFQKRGKVIFCGKNVVLKCKSKIKSGTGVTIQKNVHLDALSHRGIILNDGCSIGSGTIIRCSGNIQEIGAGFEIGKHSSLGDNCFIGATGGVYIGDNVIGGQNIRFHSSNHKFSDYSKLIRNQGIEAKGITVGDNCWIGAGVVFCDGVSIGHGCVIGANAVVTKSFPDNSIIAGVPAKLISRRLNASEV